MIDPRDGILACAIKAEGGIVMAAIKRRDFGSRIRSLKNGTTLSVIGHSGLAEHYLMKPRPVEEQTWHESAVNGLRDSCWEEHKRLVSHGQGTVYPLSFSTLICGYTVIRGEAIAEIYTLTIGDKFSMLPCSEMAFIGSKDYVAVEYLRHCVQFYTGIKTIPLEVAKCMAYCFLQEAALTDNLRNFSVEMAVITPAKPPGNCYPYRAVVEPCTDFSRYERKRLNFIKAIEKIVEVDELP